MPSERQLNANRKNAARGGPKTDEGRAAVRFNALKHGATADTLVLPGEDAEAVKQLRQDLLEEYQPATPTEHLLFEEFVRCSWRLLRMRRIETELWTGHIIGQRVRQNLDRNPTQQEADRCIAVSLTAIAASEMVNYFRYERMTTRNFYKALEKLEAAQRARRRAQPVAGPVSENGIGTVSSHPAPAPAEQPQVASPPASEGLQPASTSTRKPPVPESGPTDIDSRRCA
jgi:hypothetical protein